MRTSALRAALGIGLRVVEARGPEDFDRAFSDMSAARVDALTVFLTPVYSFGIAKHYRIDLRQPPVVDVRGQGFADFGGLIAYGPNFTDLARRAGVYAAKILKGAPHPPQPSFVISLMVNSA